MSYLPKLTLKSDALINLDALRFLAAAGVMVFHAAHYFELGSWWDSSVLDPLRLLVDLFFAISGFVIGFSYLDRVATKDQRSRFWKGRFAYIYPLHFVTFLAALAVGIAGAGQTDHPENYDPRCIPANVVLGQAWGLCSHLSFNGPSWSLSAEAVMYLLFPVFVLIAKRSRLAIPVLCVLSFLALTYASSYTSRPWHEWMAPKGALRAFPSFLFGLSLWLYRDSVRRIPAAHAALYVALAVVATLIAMRAADVAILLSIYAVMAFACSADLKKQRTKLARRVAPLGGLTMEIYLLHHLAFIAMLTVGAKRVLHLEGVAMNAAILGTFATVIAAAYVAKFAFVDPVRRKILTGRFHQTGREPATQSA
ncbi:acyltransferase [Stenotrophomonas maltophilia]|nr:acyltransferase [Stenotrophomonas maltophilia]